MVEHARFVHIVDDALPLDPPPPGEGPVLLHCLAGFLDAGNAGALAASHLLAGGTGRVVASFDVDALYDYRARRPALTFAQDHYEGYEAPRLVVRHLTDAADRSYLLLHGPEPDTYWEAFCSAVLAVVRAFGVQAVVGLGSVPMAVPHTRPTMLTQHATRADLLTQANVWSGNIRVPSSAQAVLEVRLGEAGQDAMGFVAHIPHYVAQFDYPHAATTLLEAVSSATGLTWDLDDLRSAGARKTGEITAQIEDSAEVREVVANLEQQYDALHGGTRPNLLAEDGPLPTGDELGTQFEQFLAGLNEPGPPRQAAPERTVSSADPDDGPVPDEDPPSGDPGPDPDDDPRD